MSKTKQEQTLEVKAARLRAYELYLATDNDGKRRSLRGIALSMGVTLNTVQYWRRVDQWDMRVSKAIQDQTAATGASGKALGALLRSSLFEHIGTLNAIIRDKAEQPKTRLAAIRELADITLKLKVIDPLDLLSDRPKKELPKFEDNLNESTTDAISPNDRVHSGSVLGDHHDDSVDGPGRGDGGSDGGSQSVPEPGNRPAGSE